MELNPKNTLYKDDLRKAYENLKKDKDKKSYIEHKFSPEGRIEAEARRLQKQALIFFDTKEYTKASELYLKALALDKLSADLRADLYNDMGITLYNVTKDIANTLSMDNFDWEKMKKVISQMHEGIDYFKKAIALCPNEKVFVNNLDKIKRNLEYFRSQYSPQALYNKMMEFQDKKNYNQAIELSKCILSMDNVPIEFQAAVQTHLGVCYHDGLGVNQNYAEAVKWFRKALEKGWAAAQYSLASCYENGTGVKQDYAEAMKLYRKAAEQGYVFAQNNLGIIYFEGVPGVNQDYAEAVNGSARPPNRGCQLHNTVWDYVISMV